jgi:hypothetical protein
LASPASPGVMKKNESAEKRKQAGMTGLFSFSADSFFFIAAVAAAKSAEPEPIPTFLRFYVFFLEKR